MTTSQDTNRNDAPCWLELANGGGVMLRDPTTTAVSGAKSRRRNPARGLLPRTGAPAALPGLAGSRLADD